MNEIMNLTIQQKQVLQLWDDRACNVIKDMGKKVPSESFHHGMNIMSCEARDFIIDMLKAMKK